MTAEPARLAPNLIDHFYRGGARIAALRGLTTTSDHQPEEWLGATVSREGDGVVGLARLESGELLRDLVAGDPFGWRGAGAVAGLADSDTGLLLKLLDAGQRLPVHVHPDRAFARSHLGCPYGKTEAWYVLDAEPDAVVHLGWTRDVDPEELARRVADQDGAWMLERMHRIVVRAGDGILVPAGQVHAIGAGVFVAEAQEPTDLSILLEWSVTTSGPDDAHLGLGMPTALTATSNAALDPDDLAALVHHDSGAAADDTLRACLPAAADPFFRLNRATDRAAVATGFAVLVVLAGAGELVVERGASRLLRDGEAWVVPAAAGPWWLTGDLDVLIARPGAEWPSDVLADS